MRPVVSDHSFFRPAVIVFSLFTLAQLITGSVLYVEKIGIHPAGSLEFYGGSERMLEKWPDRPDRFRNPATFEGLTKTAVSHSLAYGLFAFLLLHLLRSLIPVSADRGAVDILGIVIYATGALDILIAFAIAYGPDFMAYLRTPIFAGFVGTTSLCAIWLIKMALGNRPDRYKWGDTGKEVAMADTPSEAPKKFSTKEAGGSPSP
jgi:hypothetical protein